ncbi:hypothetical protein [Emticicia sp. W12TSBA100-4]|uniref:hypothetical protein n=1 Tax=Emticicia sp. W12TSBA100-4 TaxID=3160965 RepID=UPI003305A73E
MAGLNAMGYTKEQWRALSRKERTKASFQLFKRNVVPALLGGSLGASVLSKDPQFRKLGAVVTAIGVSGAVTKIDPTNFAGSFAALKAKGANLLNFKKPLTNDQKNGLRILGEQGVLKSVLGFKTAGKAEIKTENGENYELEYDGWGQVTTEIAEAKGIPQDSAAEIAQIVASQPASKSPQVKTFLKKLWEGVYTNLPQIIATMQNSGLDVPDDSDLYTDQWDGTGDLPPESPPPTDPEKDKKILGISQNTFVGGLGLAALGYALFKK